MHASVSIQYFFCRWNLCIYRLTLALDLLDVIEYINLLSRWFIIRIESSVRFKCLFGFDFVVRWFYLIRVCFAHLYAVRVIWYIIFVFKRHSSIFIVLLFIFHYCYFGQDRFWCVLNVNRFYVNFRQMWIACWFHRTYVLRRWRTWPSRRTVGSKALLLYYSIERARVEVIDFF